MSDRPYTETGDAVPPSAPPAPLPEKHEDPEDDDDGLGLTAPLRRGVERTIIPTSPWLTPSHDEHTASTTLWPGPSSR